MAGHIHDFHMVFVPKLNQGNLYVVRVDETQGVHDIAVVSDDLYKPILILL